jgi:hypothetical protein
MGILLGLQYPGDDGNTIPQNIINIHTMTHPYIPDDLNLEKHYCGNLVTTMCDVRLLPQCRFDLHSPGLLCSIVW